MAAGLCQCLVDHNECVGARQDQLVEYPVQLGGVGVRVNLETGQAKPGGQGAVAEEQLAVFSMPLSQTLLSNRIDSTRP